MNTKVKASSQPSHAGLLFHLVSALTATAILFLGAVGAPPRSGAQAGQIPPGGFPGMQMRRGSLTIHWSSEGDFAGEVLRNDWTGGFIKTSGHTRETLDAKISFEAPDLFAPNPILQRMLMPFPGMPQPPTTYKYEDRNGQASFSAMSGGMSFSGRVLSFEANSSYSVGGNSGEASSTVQGSSSGLSGFAIAFNGGKFASIGVNSKPFIIRVKKPGQVTRDDGEDGHREGSKKTPQHTVRLSLSDPSLTHAGSTDQSQRSPRSNSNPWTIEITHVPNSTTYKGTAHYHRREVGKDVNDQPNPKQWSEETGTLNFTFDLSGHSD